MKVIIIMHDHEQWHEVTGAMPLWKGILCWWYCCLKLEHGRPSQKEEIKCFWMRRARKNKKS